MKKVGVPNIWCDFASVYTETFEGKARLAGKTLGQFNTETGAHAHTGMMLSEFVNLVVDYEAKTPKDLQYLPNMKGESWLANKVLSDRDGYMLKMLEVLQNQLLYFGDTETGFEGLMQIANRDDQVLFWEGGYTADYLYEHDGHDPDSTPVVANAGAKILQVLNHILGDMAYDKHFLPSSFKVAFSPRVARTLKYTLANEVYNPSNALHFLKQMFSEKIAKQGRGGQAFNDSALGLFDYVIDPMLDANTPFNPEGFDLCFITIPELKDDNGEVIQDTVFAPTPIDWMVLPNAPVYRDSTARTAIKRIGSVISPIRGMVTCYKGLGVHPADWPPAP